MYDNVHKCTFFFFALGKYGNNETEGDEMYENVNKSCFPHLDKRNPLNTYTFSTVTGTRSLQRLTHDPDS